MPETAHRLVPGPLNPAQGGRPTQASALQTCGVLNAAVLTGRPRNTGQKSQQMSRQVHVTFFCTCTLRLRGPGSLPSPMAPNPVANPAKSNAQMQPFSVHVLTTRTCWACLNRMTVHHGQTSCSSKLRTRVFCQPPPCWIAFSAFSWAQAQ